MEPIPNSPIDLLSAAPQLLVKRQLWWRRLIVTIAILGLGWLLATGYGYWLSTDRLAVSGSAECFVTFSGYELEKHAAQWLAHGRAREVWSLRSQESLLTRMGIHERSSDSSLRRLHALGVRDSQIRVIPVDADESNFPKVLQAIGQASERWPAEQVIVACHSLQPRFLRQIADAALPPQQAARLRFVPLPHDEYVVTRWWACRAGWKDLYDVSMQLLTNQYFGPTSGFEPQPWNPDEWEANTFPTLTPVTP